jgi:acetyl esterase/lipase
MKRYVPLLVVVLSLVVGVGVADAQVFPPPVLAVYGANSADVASVFPAPGTPGKTVILVHGGGWHEQRHPFENEDVAMGLQRRGYTSIIIDYPEASATEAAFPKQPEAVEEAVRWAHAHAKQYNSNGDVMLLGGSSGGNIALLGGQLIDKQSPGSVSAVISLSGPTNLVTEAQHDREHLNEEPSTYWSLGRALGCLRLPLSCEGTEREWSPIDQIDPATCPAELLAGAEIDRVPLSQQQEMQAALQGAGCESELFVAAGVGHAFSYWFQVRETIFSFLAAH